jgi:hypothetical protein
MRWERQNGWRYGNCLKIVAQKHEGKIQLGRIMPTREDYIETEPKILRYALTGAQWWAVEDTVMNPQVPHKTGNYSPAEQLFASRT